MKSRAFTLIELIIVVIIVGILATLAIPQYQKAVERAKGAKARDMVKLIFKAELMYFADKGVYVTGYEDVIVPGLKDYIELDGALADTDWNYYAFVAGTIYTGAFRTSGSCRQALLGSQAAIQWGPEDPLLGWYWGYGDKWPPKACMQ